MKEHIALLTAKGSPRIVAAAGNEGRQYTRKYKYYPAKLDLPNLVAVANGLSPSLKAKASNWGSDVLWVDGQHKQVYSTTGDKVYMSGTSMSAALYTHKLLKEKCNELHKLNNK